MAYNASNRINVYAPRISCINIIKNINMLMLQDPK